MLGGAVVAEDIGPLLPPVVLTPDPAGERAPRSLQPGVFWHPALGDLILDFYDNGFTLEAIADMEGMPSMGTICKWIKDPEKLRTEYEALRLAKAIRLEDEALALVDDPLLKLDVPGVRTRFDILKWGAEVHDKSRYGKSVTVEGNPDKPVVFKFVTGVPEPTAAQTPPKLDAQGLAEKPVIDVTAGIVERPSPVSDSPQTLLDKLTEAPYDPEKYDPTKGLDK